MTTHLAQPDLPLRLEYFFPYQLSRLNASVSASVAQLYSGRFNLSPQEWRVVAVLGEHKELAAKQIANLTRMEKMQGSRAISSLKKAELIQQSTDTADRRFSRVVLSNKGLVIYEQIVPLVTAREQFLLSVLSEEETILLRNFMSRIAEQATNLEQLG